MPFRSFCHLGIHFSTFRFRVMAVFVRGPLILSFCHFAASEGSPHENGRNSETKSRKMDPKVAKRPKRRGLGPYSKKTKFLGQHFFWSFLAFFGHFLAIFWPELYEGATFEQKVFSNFCSYSDRLYKTIWHYLKFQKKVFMNRSNAHPAMNVCFSYSGQRAGNVILPNSDC